MIGLIAHYCTPKTRIVGMDGSVVAVGLGTRRVIDTLDDLGVLPALAFAAVILEFLLIEIKLVGYLILLLDP